MRLVLGGWAHLLNFVKLDRGEWIFAKPALESKANRLREVVVQWKFMNSAKTVQKEGAKVEDISAGYHIQ